MHTPEDQSQVLSLALKGSNSGIWDWDMTNDTVFFDPNYYRMAGYEPNEFPHEFSEWKKRVHPDDLAPAQKALQQYMGENAESYSAEFRFMTKSGDWMWILTKGEITGRDENGNPIRFTGLHIDISQIKGAEKAFKEERDFSTSLANTAQMIVLVLDMEGRIQRINPYMEKLTGYKEVEVKGKDWFNTFLPPADYTEIRTVFRDAVRDIEVNGVVNPIVSKDGQTFTIEWFNKTLKDIDGRVVGLLSLGVDITERRKAEGKLKVSIEHEKEIANIVRKAPIAIAYGYPDGKLENCNDAFSELTGYSVAELQAVNWNDVLTPAQWRTFEEEKLSQLSPTNNSVQYEKEYIRKNGSIVPVELVVTAKFDAAGNIINFIGFISNISERKQVEEALRTSEEKFRISFKTSPDSINLNRLSDGVYIEINEGFSKLTGYLADEVIGVSSLDLKIWKNEKNREEFVKELLEKEYVEHFEAQFVVKNGDIIDGLMSARIIEIDGEPIILSITKDITERKLTEDKYETLINEANIGIGLADATTGELLECNPALAQMLDYKREELIGQPQSIIDRGPIADNSLTQNFIQHRGVDVGNVRYQTAVTKHGKVIDVEVKATSFKLGNKTVMLGFFQDISKRKQAEQDRLKLEAQLRQKYKMDSVGVMAGGMAHNFNNNLSIILGNLELSKLKLPPQSEIGEFIDNAKIAVLRSRDLVKQIMTYSRKGEQQNNLPLQLSVIIDEVISLLKSTIPSSIYIQQNFHPDTIQAHVLANSSQIQEILLNLCNNAVHAMNEQGKLTIAMDTVELKQQQIQVHSFCQPGSYLRLSVQDAGCGMDLELQGKIFDPFFTTKDLHEGTGMGLSTVHGIMEQLQGMITVESYVGQGTTFHLFFPVINPDQETEMRAKDVVLAKGTERILFVDDDEMIVNLYNQLLSDMGYQVTIMSDSQEALKLFSANANSFQLVIADQTMPGLTGKDLIQELKQVRPDIPTILCTGFSNKVNEEEASDLGISAFMMKPIDFPQLLQTIRQVLDGDKDK